MSESTKVYENATSTSEEPFAVVEWYNYRKELFAGFRKCFNDYESARIYVFNCATNNAGYLSDELKDSEEQKDNKYFVKRMFALKQETSKLPTADKERIYSLHDDDFGCCIITEKEITDNNGDESPYNSLIGYGCSDNGYSTIFYSVVKSYPGVKNCWSEFDDEDTDGKPCYGKNY